MFGRRRRSVDVGSERSSTGRGERRGLGPFTGGQLTVIIVTFAVLLLFPIGAWALSFSNVAITDPGGVNQAKVNTAGQLLTNVGGSVTATPAPPGSQYTSVAQSASGGICHSVIMPPVGKALVITSVHLVAEAIESAYLYALNSTNCAGIRTGRLGFTEVVSAPDSFDWSFGSGITIKNGHAFAVSGSGPSATYATVYGYLVPSSACSMTTCY